MYDIIIIGAGAAGLTAAIYACRAGKKVLVLEGKGLGGQIVNTLNIENYPGLNQVSGFDFINNLFKQTEKLGVEIKFEEVIEIKNNKIKKVITNQSIYQGKSIIIATGCINRRLDLKNEQELMGRGISYCATCDGNFYKDKTVAVVGGGNTALVDALYLSDIASKVYVIHRRDEFRGAIKYLNLLKEKKNVEFLLNSNVIEINGKEKLESIAIKSEKTRKEIKIDGLFIAVGQIPESKIFKEIVRLDDNGYVLAKEDCHTNKKGLFVAGDVRRKNLRQLVTATSDGAVAAMEAVNYVNIENKK